VIIHCHCVLQHRHYFDYNSDCVNLTDTDDYFYYNGGYLFKSKCVKYLTVSHTFI